MLYINSEGMCIALVFRKSPHANLKQAPLFSKEAANVVLLSVILSITGKTKGRIELRIFSTCAKNPESMN